ncbi:MAG: type II toxin-antitoxin system VapC family toxin [Patescibacteria group bacterium]
MENARGGTDNTSRKNMVKVFLDTNIFIDAIHRAPEKQIIETLEGCVVCTSTLSFHIYCYVFKIGIPNKMVALQKQKFTVIGLSENLLDKSLEGPTNDLEDNIQLHSAAEADCEYFLTNDSKLLAMRFFGKTKLLTTWPMTAS